MKKISDIVIIFLVIVSWTTLMNGQPRIWKNNPFANTTDSASTENLNKINQSQNNSTPTMDFKLQGIWQKNNLYKAMISNKIVQMGSQIENFKVQKIQENNVILKSTTTGQMMILELKK